MIISCDCRIDGHQYNGKAEMFNGKPLAQKPVTYKQLCVAHHNIGNRYNPSTMTLYRAKDNTLRYSVYRDGCFYPYYGKIKFIQE